MSQKKKYTPLPRFRGRTGLGLMQFVKKAVLAEPKRVDMGVTIERPAVVGDQPWNPVQLARRRVPACGTVGCIAGWVVVAGSKSRDFLLLEERLAREGMVDDTIEEACRILGPKMDFNTVGPAFYNVFNAGRGDACERTYPGTKAHAQAVVARIDEFITKNREALKKRILPGRKRVRRVRK